MTQEQPSSSSPRARSRVLNVREIPVGATVRLVNDATAEVLDNPRDGMWLLCRYLSSPDNAGQVGATEPVFVHDVAEVLEEP